MAYISKCRGIKSDGGRSSQSASGGFLAEARERYREAVTVTKPAPVKRWADMTGDERAQMRALYERRK